MIVYQSVRTSTKGEQTVAKLATAILTTFIRFKTQERQGGEEGEKRRR